MKRKTFGYWIWEEQLDQGSKLNQDEFGGKAAGGRQRLKRWGRQAAAGRGGGKEILNIEDGVITMSNKELGKKTEVMVMKEASNSISSRSKQKEGVKIRGRPRGSKNQQKIIDDLEQQGSGSKRKLSCLVEKTNKEGEHLKKIKLEAGFDLIKGVVYSPRWLGTGGGFSGALMEVSALLAAMRSCWMRK